MFTSQVSQRGFSDWLKAIPWRRLSGLLCILLVAFCFWLDREQSQLSDKLLRLHVLANSDEAEDQSLKLRVRDRVLETVEPWLEEGTSAASAGEILAHRLPELTQAAQEEIQAAGYSYPVSLSLGQSWFPTRYYDGFSLPAGQYRSLRVIIGEGAGKNWWCVVFPPLCTASVTESLPQTAAQAGLTEQETFLILEDSENYVIKFKAVELWENWKHAWEEN
ncbi:MAG: Stage sporulation protein required for processing of pro-sigma-E (SpoIIR) [Firmicutes bacterium]|nr:Stage sporulation protein required for processing of pro-sigma-E (SpoIIR) [Bacillota bacterium]